MVLVKVPNITIEVRLGAVLQGRGAGLERHRFLEAFDQFEPRLIGVVVVADDRMRRHALEGLDIGDRTPPTAQAWTYPSVCRVASCVAHGERLELQGVEFPLDDQEKVIQGLMGRVREGGKEFPAKHARPAWLKRDERLAIGLAQPQGDQAVGGIGVEKHEPARFVGETVDQFLLRLLEVLQPLFCLVELLRRASAFLALQRGEGGLGLGDDGLEVWQPRHTRRARRPAWHRQ